MNRRFTRGRIARIALAATLIAPVACDDAPMGPESGGTLLVGTYVAEGSVGSLLVTTTDGSTGTTTDQLARGASIVLNLAADGSTSGRLFAPAGAGEDGIDADLTGTWSADGDRVSLAHDADTFLRDMTLVRDADTLSGSAMFNGTTVAVVLERR